MSVLISQFTDDVVGDIGGGDWGGGGGLEGGDGGLVGGVGGTGGAGGAGGRGGAGGWGGGLSAFPGHTPPGQFHSECSSWVIHARELLSLSHISKPVFPVSSKHQ